VTKRRDRPEARHGVDFPVFVSFQGKDGAVQRLACRCVNLSSSGVKVETKSSLPIRTSVLLDSTQFGRLGMASVRYCSRHGMKYNVGLQFASAMELSNPQRKKILETLPNTT
jgi:hypothetical protein